MSVVIRRPIENWDGFEKMFLRGIEQVVLAEESQTELHYVDDIRTLDWWRKARGVLQMSPKRNELLYTIAGLLFWIKNICIDRLYAHPALSTFNRTKEIYNEFVAQGLNQECIVYRPYSVYDYFIASDEPPNTRLPSEIRLESEFPFSNCYDIRLEDFQHHPPVNIFFSRQYIKFANKTLAAKHINENELTSREKREGKFIKQYFSSVVKSEIIVNNCISENYTNPLPDDPKLIQRIKDLAHEQNELQREWSSDLLKLPADVTSIIATYSEDPFAMEVDKKP